MYEVKALRLVLRGQVQGIGLRPALLRWARICSIHGWCSNTTEGVEAHLEGNPSGLDRFLAGLQTNLPGNLQTDYLSVSHADWEGLNDFVVQPPSGASPLSTAVPVDVSICSECLEELNQSVHRQQYAFNSCATCGPRYSLIREMPFERDRTAMADFPLCGRCLREYVLHSDRRFHAQTTSCAECGPHLAVSAAENEWLPTCVAAIRSGQVIAFKGVGGYQLICDATQASAVDQIRKWKCRPRKPLALLVKDLTMAATLVNVEHLQNVLKSPANAIVLCPVDSLSCLPDLSNDIHHGLATRGIMLPTTGLHALLCREVDRPLVATSGNREGEPLIHTKAEADKAFKSLCQVVVHHDRDIVRPIDDSVVRVIARKTSTIRLARGLAPLTLPIGIMEQMVALGGQQKVALALANGRQCILGPHLGELDTVASQQRFMEQYRSLCQLYSCKPRYLVHDLHPDYFSTAWAEEQGMPSVAVQHHHAHIASGMLEHGWLEREVLGIAFDGTGWGQDGSIWGGEVLRCMSRDFTRVGHLRPFRLLGGMLAIRQPVRVALALLHDALPKSQWQEVVNRCHLHHTAERLAPIMSRHHLHPLTSSMGRLFDGVAALILHLTEASYEGEPAILLEGACDTCSNGSYSLPWLDQQWDWRPLIVELVNDMLHGLSPSTMAMRFHRAVAAAVATIINQQVLPVVLSGGCFHNKILVELIAEQVDDQHQLGLPGSIPCNDGGLAAGQLVVAAARMNFLKSP